MTDRRRRKLPELPPFLAAPKGKREELISFEAQREEQAVREILKHFDLSRLAGLIYNKHRELTGEGAINFVGLDQVISDFWFTFAISSSGKSQAGIPLVSWLNGIDRTKFFGEFESLCDLAQSLCRRPALLIFDEHLRGSKFLALILRQDLPSDCRGSFAVIARQNGADLAVLSLAVLCESVARIWQPQVN